MTVNNIDGRIKLTRKIEIKIVALLRQWNSKITWDLLIKRIKVELDFEVTKPTLRKFIKITKEFGNAKSRYNGATNLPPGTAKQIGAGDVNYYEKYMKSLLEKEVMQEMLDEQYALIEKMFKNAEEIPNLSIERLIRERPEDMA
ncbi:hypothetical protein H4J50_02880 [Colwellia sp. 6M3]|jgi:hypothetical protein|uniref:hypothetical protein n=1 Tax=Colwellia sp. 6M3 TaxID=2759849 RepID=UPI0015F47B81|nr:hypothetical protein [Colwellia sp. 6M3]MBA6414952.1 hypothetical protein [Colwellia sp. 6M3]